MVHKNPDPLIASSCDFTFVPCFMSP